MEQAKYVKVHCQQYISQYRAKGRKMRVLFLHLSDMHIKDRQGLNAFQIEKIVDAINAAGKIDNMVIVISGDIAFSGKSSQYGTAYHCIGNIIAKIKKKYGFSGSHYVLCVPGNHDADYSGGCHTSRDLQDIRKVSSYERYISAELQKQTAFFNFAGANGCFTSRNAFCQKIISSGDFRIEANLINSGIFSILEEDKGLHYIPQYCINELCAPTGADFVITVMHHSPEWYTDTQKNMLEAVIYGKSSIVFYGHEHYIGNKTVSNEGNPFALIQAGGELCDNDNWTQSTFHIGVLDTNTFEYFQSKLVWNAKQQQYEQTDKNTVMLPQKPSVERTIHILPDYKKKLLEDEKHSITDNFLDYFVFPRIQAEDVNGTVSKEYTTEEDFVSAILSKKKVLINGGYNSGKTILLKSLFFRLSKDYAVLFCDIANIRGKKMDRILRNCFIDIYGENESDYLRFTQIPKEKRVIIIDDIDQIKSESFESLIEQLNDSFEYFILASKRILDLSLIDRMKVLLKANDSIFRFKIMPIFSDKRYELIQKLVNIKAEDKSTVDKTTKLLADAISSQRRFISLDPDFIIKYVEYYCNNLGDANNSDSGVFSKVFEANLINALSLYQSARLSVDKLFVLLSKIAHFIHFNKAYPITEKQIIEIIETYNSDYGSSVNYVEAITAMCNAKVLVSDGAGGFRFTNRNYLAYYVAREVNNQYNTTGDDTDLQTILKCSCFGINADILLFISYITDNIRVLQLILRMANELTLYWPEFDFDEHMPAYLKSERTHTVLPPAADAREKEREAEIAAERSAVDKVLTVDIYDYTEDEADNFVNQIVRAGSLLIVVSKCLPNFEHNMLKRDKDAFVDTIYRLPNRIFGQWATETDKNVAELIQFFKEQTQDYYSRQKVVEDDDILRALQWASISLLLDLYNLSVFYAAKDNTNQYLSSYNYFDDDTYALEHLMILERVSANRQFVDDALKMDDPKKGFVFTIALRRIVSHALVFMNGMDFRLSQQLQTKFFPQRDVQKRLMSQRLANENKKGE